MADAFDEVTPQPATQPQPDPYASTVQTIEGWYPASKSYRNNNPGNLHFKDQPGATGADKDGFAIFPDYNTGREALHNQINLDARRGLSIQDFVNKYAPQEDGNDPKSYAAKLASSVGKTPTDKLAGDAFTDGGDAFDSASAPPKDTTPTPQPGAWDSFVSDLKGQANYLKGMVENIPGDLKANIHNPFSIASPAEQTAAMQNPNVNDPHTNDAALVQGAKDFYNDPAGVLQRHPVGAAMNVAGLLGLAKAGAGEGAEPGETMAPGTSKFETMHRAAVKPIIEAMKPTDPVAFEDSMQRTIPLLKQENPNIANVIRKDPRSVGPIVDSALGKLSQKMGDFVAPAELEGRRIDGNIIANEKMSAIPPKLKLTDPNAYEQMKEEADTYRRALKPSEVQSYLETTNDQAAGLYDKLPGERNISVGASADRKQLITEANVYREQLYRELDPEHNGAMVRALQLRRGSLIDFKNNMDQVNANILNSPTPSLANKVGSLYDTAKSVLPTTEGRGGPALDRAASALKNPQNVQNKIARGFDKWKGNPLVEIESPPMLTRQFPNTAPFNTPSNRPAPPQPTPTPGMPEGLSAFYRQRNLFPDDLPEIPGNTRIPNPRYPGQPPSSSIDETRAIPGDVDRRYTDAEVIQHQLLPGKSLLPPGSPRQINAPESLRNPTPPPTSFKQGGGPYRIVSSGGAELGGYESLAYAQQVLDKFIGGNTGEYRIHYKPQKQLPSGRQLP